MGYNKITNPLGKLGKDEIPKFTTIKWIEIFDQSNGTCNKSKDIRFKTNQLRNDLNEDAQDLDIVIPMYNLLYYSKNFLELFFIPKSGHNDDNSLRERIIYPIKDSESFNYKIKLVGNVHGVVNPADGDDIERELEDIKIVVSLKDISNFMFNLDFLLINSEIELILKWTEDCVLTEKATREFR